MRPGPLTTLLIKIFAYRFYKIHAGFLLFFFVSAIVYFFFINVLNQTHLPADQVKLYNLIFVLTYISSPILVAAVFIAWLAYTIKTWRFIMEQSSIAANLFLS